MNIYGLKRQHKRLAEGKKIGENKLERPNVIIAQMIAKQHRLKEMIDEQRYEKRREKKKWQS